MENEMIEKFNKMSDNKQLEFIREFMGLTLKMVDSNVKGKNVGVTVIPTLDFDEDTLLENLTEFVNR